ncbi:MAG: 50S ribosomal protein L25 [Nitrospinae bacterium]|nr:50S ribosomal protein L25 [Nitrospinota bacterium]
MSENDVLSGSVRQAGRKGPARRLRSEGLVPGVVYGMGENVSVSASAKQLLKILEATGGSHHIITTQFDGDTKKRHVMVKKLDVHPVTDQLIHVDLLEIDLNKPVRVKVDLEFAGPAKGVKEKGGELKISLGKISVECMPTQMPDLVTVSIVDLDLGQTLRVKDLPAIANAKVLEDPEAAVVAVVAVKATPAEEAAAATAAAAPAAGAAPAAAAKPAAGAAKPAGGGKGAGGK